MLRQKLITILGVVAAISAAILAQIQAISPKAAGWVMLVGAVAAASGGALAKFLESNLYITLVGLGVAVTAVLAQAGGVIGAGKSQVAAIIGAALAAIGKSLFGWGDTQPPTDNPNGSSLKAFFPTILIPALLLATLGQSGCWFKGKEQSHQVALATANSVVALSGSVDAAGVLQGAGKLSPEGNLAFRGIAKQVNESLAVVLGRARDGYTKNQLLPILAATLEDVAKAEQAGIGGISDLVARERFQDAVFVLRFTVETIQQIIASGKEPQVPADKAEHLKSAQATRQSGFLWVGQIVEIVKNVYFEMWSQSKLDKPGVIADGFAKVGALREKLAAQ